MSAIALPLKEAAAAVGHSVDTIRRALRQTEPGVFPPPLRGKRDSKGRITIRVTELERWHDSLEDV